MAKWSYHYIDDNKGSGFGAFIKSITPALSAAGSAVSPLLGIGMNILGNTAGSWFQNRVVNSSLTGKEREQNAWNAEQAQINRDYQTEMSNTAWQRGVADMAAAGLNPALAYGQGGASTPLGNNAQGSTGLMGAVQVYNMMQELKMRSAATQSEVERNEKEGDAAVINANANAENVETGKRQAAVAEARVDIERALADKHLEVDDATINQMAENAAYIKELKKYVGPNYQVALKNASSSAKQAVAALRHADAAVQEAATHSYIADYQTDMMYGETILNDVLTGEHREILKILPEELRTKVDNMIKEGITMDKRGNWYDKHGKLMQAQKVHEYVRIGTDIASALCNIVSTASSALGSGSKGMSFAPGGFGSESADIAGVIGAM